MGSYLAANLVGKIMGRWTVMSKIEKPDGSGGGFSSGYIVESEGQKAYLKAMNVHYAFASTGKQGTLMDTLNRLTEDFIHERDLLRYCDANSLDRIVVALDSGEYVEPSDPFPVPYLVFELCENGDVRRNPKMHAEDLSWRLRVFHGACVGVRQLHGHGIAHQDIKPANILVFRDDHAKIADLGRSTKKEVGSRFGHPEEGGDAHYSPFEFLYGHYNPDWDVRRKGTDIFMLGGFLCFLVGHVHLLGEVFSRLPISYHPGRWRGSFSAVLPALSHAFAQSVDSVAATIPAEIRNDIKDMLTWMCNPDPMLRGHPKNHSGVFGDRFSLERIISVADRLSWKARLLSR